MSRWTHIIAGLSLGALLLCAWGFLIYLIALVQRGAA